MDVDEYRRNISLAVEIPEYLLDKNQLQTDQENIDLFDSVQTGSLSSVRAALSRGGKPNCFFRQFDWKNSLHLASEKGFTEIVQYLLENGGVADSRAAASQATSLILSSINGHTQIVRLLLASGAIVNLSNGYGNTALHEACRHGYYEIIKLLLEAGAHINQINKKGSSPLHFLCYGSDPQAFPISLFQLLLSAGADLSLRDGTGLTPLLVACSSGRLDVVKLFIQHGADVTAVDEKKKGAYDIAVFYNKEDVATYFSQDAPFTRFAVASKDSANIPQDTANADYKASSKESDFRAGTSAKASAAEFGTESRRSAAASQPNEPPAKDTRAVVQPELSKK